MSQLAESQKATAAKLSTAQRDRIVRWTALIAGTLGALFAVATPFLPVKQTTAELHWPQSATVADVSAPLIGQRPVDVHASVPCSAVNQLPPEGGLLISTAPTKGTNAPQSALFIRATATDLEVIARNAPVATVKRERLTQCSTIEFSSTAKETSAEFVGLVDPATGQNTRGSLVTDERPQIVGVYSDLRGEVPGLRFSATIDTRFSSTPTLIKQFATFGAVLFTIISLIALAMMDGSDGRKHRRILPTRWWRLHLSDVFVVGTLGVWHLIGANTSDDGYLLTMTRVSDHAGYLANYFRWFGVPEAPFGWYYEVQALFGQVSTASSWVRLPALACGIVSWWVISREVVPRLGRAVRTNQVALWTGGFVFLAFWLPYNNGLRSEPIVALGALLTWCSIERAIATGRLAPAAVAALTGAFTLAAAPTGLMCVAALAMGAKPIIAIIVRRHRQHGVLPLLAPIGAAGLLVLVVVFADQTFAGIMEANRVRQEIGPNLAWFKDYLRYYYLFVQTVDGSVARRFAFLTMILCVVTASIVLVRRRRISGIASGPAWRLIGIVIGTIFLMMFNPTKWTHHFGAYAGIAGSLGALTAAIISVKVLRAVHNRTAFGVAMAFVLALSFAGVNGYWYVSSYGVPWYDKPVSIKGIQSYTVWLVICVALLVLVGWQSVRADYRRNGEARWRRTRLGAIGALTPLTLAAGILVVFEVMSLAKGVVAQYPDYSIGRSNLDALRGKPCGLANDVLVEEDANAGLLTPIADAANPPTTDPLLSADSVGFTPNGLPREMSAEQVEVIPGMANTVTTNVGPTFEQGQPAGTEGGVGPIGVNGSYAKLPFGLDPARVPVVGTFQDDLAKQQPSHTTTSWYALGERSPDSPVIAIAAAGRIRSLEDDGTEKWYGQSLVLEYGKRQPDGTVTVLGNVVPRDPGPFPSWRSLRVPFTSIAPEADAVRLVAFDPILARIQWLAFTPPRVPKLRPLNDVIGSAQPVLLDWAVGLQFPCQRPLDHFNGVAEVPNYRILPDNELAVSSTDTWQAHENGGLLGFSEMISTSDTMATYLRGKWDQDWGSLEKYRELRPAPEAELDTSTAVRSGLWSPGPILREYR